MEPTLALCMIVRNEQAVLRRCLSSVAHAVDSIYITDTGSTDGTLDIAREFRAKIRHFAWCDDFSAARNYSIQDVAEDWLLILDADDVFPEGEAAKLRSHLKSAQELTLTVDYAVELEYTPAATRKVLRNRSGIRFAGYIHENVRGSLPQGGRHHTEHAKVSLLHTGYENDLSGKLRRNLPLLQREQARAALEGDELQRMVIRRELGWTWLLLGETGKGEQMLREALAARWPEDEEELNAYAVEVLSALNWHLYSQERYEEALDLTVQLGVRLSGVPAYWLSRGQIEFKAGRFADALGSFKKFESGWQAGRLRTPVPEVYTGMALWDIQAQCCLSLERGEEAAALFSKCLASGGDSQEYSAKLHLARRFSK